MKRMRTFGTIVLFATFLALLMPVASAVLSQKQARQLIVSNGSLEGITRIPILINRTIAGICTQPNCYDYVPYNDTGGTQLQVFDFDYNTTTTLWLWTLQNTSNKTVTYDFSNDSTATDRSNTSVLFGGSSWLFVMHGNRTDKSANIYGNNRSTTNPVVLNNTPLGQGLNTSGPLDYGSDQRYWMSNASGFIRLRLLHTSGSGLYIGKGDFTNGRNIYGMGVMSGSVIGCELGDNSTLQNIQAVSTTTIVGNWTELLCSWNSTSLTFYVNGFKTNQSVRTSTLGQNFSMPLRLGGGNDASNASSFPMVATFDEAQLGNFTPTDQEVQAMWAQGRTIYNIFNATQAAATPQINFSINASDLFNISPLLIWNVTINGTLQFNVTNGVAINTTIPINSTQLFNLTFVAPGYFNVTLLNYNVSNNTDQRMWQVLENIYAFNLLSNASISVFAARIGSGGFVATYNATTGNVTLPIPAATAMVNITANGYSAQQINFSSMAVLTTNVSNVYLIPVITMRLYNESDGLWFWPNSTSGVTLRVFCPTQTIVQNLFANVTSVPISCNWNKMRVYVTYNTTTYFRTLQPTATITNVDWYLINLNITTAVQKTFYLNDLAGQYNTGNFRVDKIVGNNQVTINQESWDVENKVVAYFTLYDLYILSLIDNIANTRALGYFVADTQATHTITVPTIPFSPTQTIDDFQWSYLFDKPSNTSPGSLFMQYTSTTGTVYNVTWLVVNATSKSQVFINMSFFTANGSMNFTALANGTQYLSVLTYNHSSYSTHADQHVWNELQQLLDDTLAGLQDPAGFKKWISFIAIVGFTLTFSGTSTSAAAVVAAVLVGFFYGIGWLPISAGLLIVLEIIALFVALLGEGIK